MPKRKIRVGRARTGLGLFATHPIRKREYVATYRGPLLPNAEADRLEARGSRYMFEVNSRWTIDGSRRYNVARYVNHSCRPNVDAIERRGKKIVYIARRKIKPDEEIVVDYGKDYFSAFIGKSRCACPKCRERRADQAARSRARVKRRKVKAAKLRREASATARSKAARVKTRGRVSRRASKARRRGT